MKISLQSQLKLYPLSIRRDKKNYIVEEPISGEFFEMPKICIDAIERLEKGETIGSIEKVLKEQYPDEDVDMIDFAEQLIELGLVQEIDGVKVSERKMGANENSNGLTWIPSRLGRFFFNRIMNKVYLLLLFLNIFFFVFNPELLPHYKDIFIFDTMVLNIITYLLISLILIIIHEVGHVLAIRAHNLPAKLSIGNRLIFIVFETDLTAAWKLDPKQRNILYFAGMCFEQVIMFVALSMLLLFPNVGFASFLSIIVFDIFIKTIYQCCFYMKTDVYYIVENITGCYNLMESGKEYIRSFFKGKSGKDYKQIYQGELNVVRAYSAFYVAGVIVTFLLAFVYFIPQLYFMFDTIFANVRNPENPGAFWDAVAILIQMLIVVGILIYIKMKKRREVKN